MAGHGEMDIDEQKVPYLYQMVLTLLFTLNKTEMKSIDRQKEARDKISRLISKIIIEMNRTFGFTPDVSSDLQSRSTERASKVIQDLLEEFGSINHLEQDVCTTSKKRQRTDTDKDTVRAASDISTETPVEQYDNASALEQGNGEAEDCWGDDLVNNAVFSPMAKVNPMEIENGRQTFVEGEQLEYAVYSAPAPERDNDCDLDNHPARFDQRQRTEGFTPSTSAEKFNGNGKASPEFFTPSQDNADRSAENALPTERNRGGRNSEVSISSASSSSSFSSAVAVSTFSTATAAAKGELDSMQNDFKENGIAAGNPSVPFILRIVTEKAFASGNLSDIIEHIKPMIYILQAKASSAEQLATHVASNAKKLRRLASSSDSSSINFGTLLTAFEEEDHDKHTASAECDAAWIRTKGAIYRSKRRDDHSAEHGVIESSDLESLNQKDLNEYCGVSRQLKNLCNVYGRICLAIIAMSLLKLRDLDPQMEQGQSNDERRWIDEAEELYFAVVSKGLLESNGVFNPDVISVKDFFENVFLRALASADRSLVASAVKTMISMKKSMLSTTKSQRDIRVRESIRKKFMQAQQFRINGRGSTNEGEDYCGSDSKTHSINRASMITLVMNLSLSRQIEAEFGVKFFDQYGSFNRTFLSGAWRDIRSRCNLFVKEDFFVSIFSRPNNNSQEKEKARDKMKELIEKKNLNPDTMAIVVYDTEQMEGLQKFQIK